MCAAVSNIGACLSIDHTTPVEISVDLHEESAELRCPGVDVYLNKSALDHLIEICELLVPKVDVATDRVFRGAPVTTWLECDKETRWEYSQSRAGTFVELRSGTVSMAVTGPALAALLKDARIARDGLEQHVPAT